MNVEEIERLQAEVSKKYQAYDEAAQALREAIKLKTEVLSDHDWYVEFAVGYGAREYVELNGHFTKENLEEILACFELPRDIRGDIK
jgi:hypothetical protein